MYLGKLKTIKDLKNIIDNYNDDEEIVFIVILIFIKLTDHLEILLRLV